MVRSKTQNTHSVKMYTRQELLHCSKYHVVGVKINKRVQTNSQ